MKNHMLGTWSAVLLLAALVLAVTTPALAQDAGALFKSKCSVCHSPDGSGSSATGKQLGVTDLRADEVQKQTDAQLNDSITSGKGTKMPAYKGKITDDQIKGLVGYIRSLAKKG
ncbi:MAG TPA: cytochrome c [Candidatus Acidoferrales bacterium]|jgi:mono/diheme cytochrome c family protein